MKLRTIIVIAALLALFPLAASTAADSLFSEDFEGNLAVKWTGRDGGGSSGIIVDDPLRNANKVLAFRTLASGGDLFSTKIPVTKSKKYRLAFDFMGKQDSGGGIVGVSLATPGHHRWLAGTAGGRGAGESNPLVTDGKWRRYKIDFSPGDRTWFTPDGSQAVDPGAITSLRIMVEQNWGTPGDAYFDNFTFTECSPTCGAGGEQPVRVNIKFHANNLKTAAPNDGGQCPGRRQDARVDGEISAQITRDGDHQGGGNVVDTPYRSRCRVPTIGLRVDRVRIRVIEPGDVMRAILKVHINSEGVHRDGQCRVGTDGTIVATYDDTSRARNSLRNDRFEIGQWSRPCPAHTHVIHNNISSITAGAAGSTWVRVQIACLGQGTGYAPRNCEAD